MANGIDPRIARTRASLVEALIGLLTERTYADVSVADIARRAGVNRATFYLHYESKDDLFERGIDALFESLAASFETRIDDLSDVAEARQRISAFFRMVDEKRKLFEALVTAKGGTPLMERASAFLERFLVEWRFSIMPGSRPSVPTALAAKLVASVLQGLVAYRISGSSIQDPGKTADMYIRFMSAGLTAIGFKLEPSIAASGN